MKVNITKLLTDVGLSQYICTSFKEAHENPRIRSFVVIDNKNLYETYKYNGMFGLLRYWTEEDFKTYNKKTIQFIIDDVKNVFSLISDEELKNDLLLKKFMDDMMFDGVGFGIIAYGEFSEAINELKKENDSKMLTMDFQNTNGEIAVAQIYIENNSIHLSVDNATLLLEMCPNIEGWYDEKSNSFSNIPMESLHCFNGAFNVFWDIKNK